MDSCGGNFQMVNFCRLGVVSLERKRDAKFIFDSILIVSTLSSYWGCPSNSDSALPQVDTFQNWNKFVSEDVPIQCISKRYCQCSSLQIRWVYVRARTPPKDSALDFVLSKNPGDNEKSHGIVCGVIDNLIMWQHLLKSYKYSIRMYNRAYTFAHSKSALLVLSYIGSC